MGYSRREILRLTGLSGLCLVGLPSLWSYAKKEEMRTRPIPISGELLPIVGLGTWQTFDVGNDQTDLHSLEEVLTIMHNKGGNVIDSSPMYGRSEEVVGQLTQRTGLQDSFFYATKVWTVGKDAGIAQMNASLKKMQRPVMDLIQIHNLVDWQVHVKTLRALKEQGKIRYWGLTHYTDSAQPTLEKIIRQERPDFVQFNYSIRSRNAEKSLFDTVKKHEVAVLINQPYESGTLFQQVKGKPLPEWSSTYDIQSWGQYFLKFILSNHAVTCVIPGTAKPEHAVDNMMAGFGTLPDTNGRERMAKYFEEL